jgi:formamidopyrimidine-DNA glycosylase
MPELAEVEYFRKLWNPGLNKKVSQVYLHPSARDFRGCNTETLKQHLSGSILRSSEAKGKQLLFRFSGNNWLGIHLGMSGKLSCVPTVANRGDGSMSLKQDKHDHLVLLQSRQTLIFSDYRMFGLIRFQQGKEVPEWWRIIAPALSSNAFDRVALKSYLTRRRRSPIKGVLFAQERFPGLGNWMVDEILWRARIRPHCRAGRIEGKKLNDLFHAIKEVCRDALDVIGKDWGDPPDTWLFNHRWDNNGRCPKTGKPLKRETICGRTTCWSPSWQRWPDGS